MKSFSKRVASFTMAAAMVLSLAAVSPVDAEAATAKITKKSSITAGKTYTYNVKNVTKSQYIKVRMSSGVTVKYNNKTVKKNSTKIKGGKTIALKVKAADKVANYKATLKAVIYNKKTNKKVKTLTTQSTVKCTKLAIKSVEPATLAGSHKYIVVKFNKALSSLDASEVIIREKDTDRLVTVEKVTLASNGKSATLTLLGDALTSGESFILANTDYVLSVTKAGATAAMDFNFPAVQPDESVVKVDAGKRTITTRFGTYTVPTTISVDFQEILGRTVTFWYNKNNEITKLNVAKETVVYDAFGISRTNDTVEFASKTSDAKYTSVSGNSTGTIYSTKYLAATGKNYAAVPADKANIAYAKLVLNPNGTIRTASYEEKMDGRVLASSVAGNIITESKKVSANLKDYTIVKDGKTIAITDIQAGDVVFYNSSDKYAEVYKKTVVGTVTNVTDEKVTVAGTAYEYIKEPTKYTVYVENNSSEKANADYFVSLKTAAKDATLYLDRFGKVVYVSGDKGTVATTSREIVITDYAKAYNYALDNYIKISGSDGTTTAVPEVKFSDLKTVKFGKWTYSKDTTTNSSENKQKVKSFDSFSKDTIGTTGDVLTGIAYTPDGTNYAPAISNASGLASIANVVVLTLDSSNSKVVGIEFQFTTLSVSENVAFEKGKSTIAVSDDKNYQIVSSTPVYEITKDAASVTKTTYGEYAKKTNKDKYSDVSVYVDGGNVAKVVINNKSGLVYDEAQDTKVTGVVIGRETLNDKIVSLTIVSEGTTKSFTDFTDTVKDGKTGSAVSGNVVTVTYGKDNNKVSDITVVKAAFSTQKELRNKEAAVAYVSNGKIDGKELATAIVPTIVQKDGNSWKTITYGELSDLVATTDYSKNKVVIDYKQLATDIIDYVVVKVESL